MSAIGTKRTYRVALHMSAFDPKRTSPAPVCPLWRVCLAVLHNSERDLAAARTLKRAPLI